MSKTNGECTGKKNGRGGKGHVKAAIHRSIKDGQNGDIFGGLRCRSGAAGRAQSVKTKKKPNKKTKGEKASMQEKVRK